MDNLCLTFSPSWTTTFRVHLINFADRWAMFQGMEGFWKRWSKLEMARLYPAMLQYWVLQKRLYSKTHSCIWQNIKSIQLNSFSFSHQCTTLVTWTIPMCLLKQTHIWSFQGSWRWEEVSNELLFFLFTCVLVQITPCDGPVLNRCDTSWTGTGSADHEERRVLSVPLWAPVCLWGLGLSSTYPGFCCSFVRGPRPRFPRLRTSWRLYWTESGKKLLWEDKIY